MPNSDETANSQDDSKKKCRDCREIIDFDARRCKICGTFQNWRYHIQFTSTLFSLLIALLSVSTLAYSYALSLSKPAESEVKFSVPFVDDKSIYLVGRNDGLKQALLRYATLNVIKFDTTFEPKRIGKLPDNKMIEAESSNVFRLSLYNMMTSKFIEDRIIDKSPLGLDNAYWGKIFNAKDSAKRICTADQDEDDLSERQIEFKNMVYLVFLKAQQLNIGVLDKIVEKHGTIYEPYMDDRLHGEELEAAKVFEWIYNRLDTIDEILSDSHCKWTLEVSYSNSDDSNPDPFQIPLDYEDGIKTIIKSIILGIPDKKENEKLLKYINSNK
jgi:hypothetical protein